MEGFRIGHPIHLSWGERLWPFVAGEFAFESAAWLALEIFLVVQVVAWVSLKVRVIAARRSWGSMKFSWHSKGIQL